MPCKTGSRYTFKLLSLIYLFTVSISEALAVVKVYSIAPVYLYKAHTGVELDIVSSEEIARTQGSKVLNALLISDRVSTSIPEGLRYKLGDGTRHVKALIRFSADERNSERVFIVVEKGKARRNDFEALQVSNTEKWPDISKLPDRNQDLTISSLVVDASSCDELFLIDLKAMSPCYLDVVETTYESRFLVSNTGKGLSLSQKKLSSGQLAKLKKTVCSRALTDFQRIIESKASTSGRESSRIGATAMDIPGHRAECFSITEPDSLSSSGRGSLSLRHGPSLSNMHRLSSEASETNMSGSGYWSSNVSEASGFSDSGQFRSSHRSTVISSSYHQMEVATGMPTTGNGHGSLFGRLPIPPEGARSGDSVRAHTMLSSVAPMYDSTCNIDRQVSQLNLRRQSHSGFESTEPACDAEDYGYVEIYSRSAGLEFPPGCLAVTTDMFSRVSKSNLDAGSRQLQDGKCRTRLRNYLPKIVHRHVRGMSDHEFDCCRVHVSAIVKLLYIRGCLPRQYTQHMFSQLGLADDWDHPVHVAAFESLDFVLRLCTGWNCHNPWYKHVVVDVASYIASINHSYWLYPFQAASQLHARFQNIKVALDRLNAPVSDDVYSVLTCSDEADDNFVKLHDLIHECIAEYFMDVFCRQVEHYAEHPPGLEKLQSYGLSPEDQIYDSTADEIHHIAKVIGLLSLGFADAFTDSHGCGWLHKILMVMIRRGEFFLSDAGCQFTARELADALSLKGQGEVTTALIRHVVKILGSTQAYVKKNYAKTDFSGDVAKRPETMSVLYDIIRFLGGIAIKDSPVSGN
ncbi:hypothetical protein ACWJJH_07845 [Endozoicomonadaceae bacterium StTr2]